MSENLHLAQAIAWNLTTTLMTCITLFKGDSGYSVVETCKLDGDAQAVLYEYNPHGEVTQTFVKRYNPLSPTFKVTSKRRPRLSGRGDSNGRREREPSATLNLERARR